MSEWVQDHFADSRWLLGLLVVPALLAAYVVLQRRRSAYAVRFTNLDLLADVVERSPRWRRHVPAAFFLAAVLALGVGLARPQGTVRVPRDEATVVLILDVSGSMRSDDVKPTRLQAAQASAQTLVKGLPPRVQVGVIAFSTTVRVLASPTTDRDAVDNAIEGLQAQGGTAMGDALLTAVGLVRPEAQAATDERGPVDGGAVNADPKKRIPATVLLLSDGANTVGQAQPLDAADIANQLDVPVYTVALGTAGGEALVPDPRGQMHLQKVPPDPDTLRAIAERTKAQFFEAPSASQLDAVYKDLGRKVGYRNERRDATHVPLAIGLGLLLVSAVMSLAWSQRLP
jgi:Ca-activated chloride channel family protein